MICKHCKTENPEESVFCMHCGKRMDEKKICPSCGATCPEEAIFCNSCGTKMVQEESGGEPIAAEPQPQSVPAVPKEKNGTFEKVRSVFDLSGGICLMAAVLFAFVFVFCMGITATASVKSSFSSATVSVSASETKMMWEFFGSEYEELAEALDRLPSYSGYYEAANYIPVVLSTVVCAGTLISVLVCTVIAAVKYGRHFKHPEVKYAKPAIAAVLSFVLGATAFLMINSTSLVYESDTRVSIHFSDATLAGIILGATFLGLYCVSRVAVLGKEFVTKKVIINFVCTLVGILFVSLTAAFAASPSLNTNLNLSGKASLSKFELNFFNSNTLISGIFTDNNIKAVPENFIETFVVSLLAQIAQIALLVLAFILLIKRTGGFENDSKSCLGISIATFALAIAYLVLSCVAIHFGNELLVRKYSDAEISIAAAPIVALVASAFAFAGAITHKVLLKKTV